MKSQMRKLFVVSTSLALMMGLAACGSSDDDDDDNGVVKPPFATMPQGAVLKCE